MQDPKSQKINLLYIFFLFGDGEEDKKNGTFISNKLNKEFNPFVN